MALWRIRVNTRFGWHCGYALATTKKACMENAWKRMPWLSKRHLMKECERINDKEAL